MTVCREHFLQVGRGFLLLLGCLLLMGKGHAQVIDEQTPQSGTWLGVGADSLDFVGQSFISDIWQARAIGVWLQASSPDARVRISLVGDQGGLPDLSTVYHESALISPSDTGSWVIDSSFVNFVLPGTRYWVLVDGYNNLAGTGYAAVGTSGQFTDTGEPLHWSSDGGATWVPQTGQPLAVYVAGDTCTFPLTINPVGPVLCPGKNTRLFVPDGFHSYAWSTGETSSGIEVSATGNYSVFVLDEDYCVGAAGVNVQLDLIPPISLDSIYQVCGGGQVNLAVNPFYVSYEWSTGAITSTITVDQPGPYWVEGETPGGCVYRDTTFVVNLPVPDIDLGNDTSLCQGQFIQLDAGPGYASYSWSNGSASRSTFADSDDSLWVNVVDTNGCTATSDTLVVQVFPVPDTPAISQNLGNLVSTFGFGYQWFRDGSELTGETNQTLESPEAGFYQVRVENAFGCTAWSDTLFLETEELGSFISEGFSPNGDGLNEVFFVEGVELYPGNSLLVYNRWGEEVFRKQPYQNDWRGDNQRGGELPDGNYFYVFDFGNGEPVRKGTVLINR